MFALRCAKMPILLLFRTCAFEGIPRQDSNISQSPLPPLTLYEWTFRQRTGAMPPVLDVLQSVFPDIVQQPVSAIDEAAPVSDAAQTQLQPSADVTQAYSGRISAINTKVRCSNVPVYLLWSASTGAS